MGRRLTILATAAFAAWAPIAPAGAADAGFAPATVNGFPWSWTLSSMGLTTTGDVMLSEGGRLSELRVGALGFADVPLPEASAVRRVAPQVTASGTLVAWQRGASRRSSEIEVGERSTTGGWGPVQRVPGSRGARHVTVTSARSGWSLIAFTPAGGGVALSRRAGPRAAFSAPIVLDHEPSSAPRLPSDGALGPVAWRRGGSGRLRAAFAAGPRRWHPYDIATPHGLHEVVPVAGGFGGTIVWSTFERTGATWMGVIRARSLSNIRGRLTPIRRLASRPRRWFTQLQAVNADDRLVVAYRDGDQAVIRALRPRGGAGEVTIIPARVGSISIAGLSAGRVLAAWSARTSRYAPLHLYAAVVTPGMPAEPQRLDPDTAWAAAFRSGPVRVVTQWDGSAAVVASAAGGPGALVLTARRLAPR